MEIYDIPSAFQYICKDQEFSECIFVQYWIFQWFESIFFWSAIYISHAILEDSPLA